MRKVSRAYMKSLVQASHRTMPFAFMEIDALVNASDRLCKEDCWSAYEEIQRLRGEWARSNLDENGQYIYLE